VLVCIGRVPYTEGLGLKEAGIAIDNFDSAKLLDNLACIRIAEHCRIPDMTRAAN